jgi:hypothetical protein
MMMMMMMRRRRRRNTTKCGETYIYCVRPSTKCIVDSQNVWRHNFDFWLGF